MLNIFNNTGSLIIIALVSLKIKLSSGRFNGTPPLVCLGPSILKNEGILLPSILPITVSPPSASKLASFLGTAVILLVTLILEWSLKLVLLSPNDDTSFFKEPSTW